MSSSVTVMAAGATPASSSAVNDNSASQGVPAVAGAVASMERSHGSVARESTMCGIVSVKLPAAFAGG
ncbi:hypothetical protein NS228_01905 [Methylobacterium indicum]|nr:hypothetical protein NS229_22300 [Methylobacterium indicum]KTS42570.1 hypothetical protein NS228_01905 [Methylobacterium indicum]KTS50302.1 hypothetical protein NS230_16370 [Methylobacterium indicum]